MIRYSAAKIIVRHPSEEKLLLVHRTIRGVFGYEPAGGRIDIDFKNNIAENFEECAIREAKEELELDVKLTEYLGSFYFFWGDKTTDKHGCTNCVVFFADSVSDISLLRADDAIEEIPVTPEWVNLEAILANTLPINPACIGLNVIFQKAALLQQKIYQEHKKASLEGAY